MPELPEVEVTRRGLVPVMEDALIERVIVRNRSLRWPVPDLIETLLAGRIVRAIERRAKYLLFRFDHGTMIVHLGMSGSLRPVDRRSPPTPWDHVEWQLGGGERAVRLRDPRRFGSVLWHVGEPGEHPLLARLGVEPLSPAFDGELLYRASRGRHSAVKVFLMDAAIVVGVGNIYASESLFRAGIHPATAAGRIRRERYDRLAEVVRATLNDALAAGGSTLRDFVGGDGKPGYFQQSYFVYGREGEPCLRCARPIRRIVQGQRSSFYCPSCQH